MMNKPISELTTTWVDPFVAQYQMDDTTPCLNTIHEAEQLGTWFPSITHGGYGEEVVDTKFRDSEQINYDQSSPSANHEVILNFAERCLKDYLHALPAADNFPTFFCSERYNIIRYNKGQAYHAVHTDYYPYTLERHLTFVMFLNTVDSGGELEFVHQNLYVKSKEGRCIIFPSGWTHAHHTLPTDSSRYVFQMWWGFPPLQQSR